MPVPRPSPGSVLNQMNKQQLRDARMKLFDMLGEGLTDQEVRLSLGLSGEDYEALKYGALKMKGEEWKDKPTEVVFAEYFLQQMNNINELSGLIQRFEGFRQQASAVVGAIRARADIMDKVIERGQEFNIIERKPEERRIVAGVLVANLSNDQLKGAIVRELGNLNRLLKGVGGPGKALMLPEAGLLELPAETIYKDVAEAGPKDPTELSDNPVVEALHPNLGKGPVGRRDPEGARKLGLNVTKMRSKFSSARKGKAKSGRKVVREKAKLEDIPGLGNVG